MKNASLFLAGVAALVPVATYASTGSVSLRAEAPVVCNITVDSSGPTASGSVAQLGSVRELCNTPRGYRIEVIYQPGTLVGATVQLGSDSVRLDGAGRAVITDSAVPAVRTRQLTMTAGDAGFNSSQFELRIDHKG
jgi:hypothetical protein